MVLGRSQQGEHMQLQRADSWDELMVRPTEVTNLDRRSAQRNRIEKLQKLVEENPYDVGYANELRDLEDDERSDEAKESWSSHERAGKIAALASLINSSYQQELQIGREIESQLTARETTIINTPQSNTPWRETK